MKLVRFLLGRPPAPAKPSLREVILKVAGRLLAVGHRQNASGNNMSQR